MRKDMKKASHLGGTASCLTSTLAWLFGQFKDPAVALKVEQLSHWFDIWQYSSQGERKRIRDEWRRRLVSIFDIENPTPIHMVRESSTGPISATIGILLEIGWKPSAPDQWTAPNGDRVNLSTTQPYTLVSMIGALQGQISESLWKDAAKHRFGSGLERGTPDFAMARKAKKYLIKKGNYDAASALDFIVSGATMDPVVE